MFKFAFHSTYRRFSGCFVAPNNVNFVLKFYIPATMPAISERLAGTIIVLFVLARLPNAFRYCSEIQRFTAFRPLSSEIALAIALVKKFSGVVFSL